MTTLLNFRNHLLTCLLAIASMMFISCEDRGKIEAKTDSEEMAEDANKPNDDASKERDEQFLMKAAEINLEEIALGNLALQKTSNADVKALAQMMVDAHTKAQADLTGLASRKSIAVPTTPTNDINSALSNMSQKSGMDFDKEYCDKMVAGHKDAIDKFENMSNNQNSDADIRNWASAMLPDLRTHLQHAEMCKDKLSNMK